MVDSASVVVREWGNSLGVRIPYDMVIKNGIKPTDEVVITVTKKEKTLRDFFGMGRRLKGKIDAQKLKDEAKEEWGMN
ncbi:MAG: antitoxin component of MazEF toxin-antitoxin module [Patescibacteria group bacterium]|jgi:antitoxin component of MazEF toxin-antitoxin module